MALFKKMIQGDDALLQLASLRFKESGLGTEFYAETLDELDWLFGFIPSPDIPVTVHLHRNINIFEEKSQRLILDFASTYKGQIYGLVIHDQVEINDHFSDYVETLKTIQSKLSKIHESPNLFIEYAVGLEPNLFVDLFTQIHDLEQVSACIDIGHVGIRQARENFSLNHPGKDICALSPNDIFLKEVIADVESSVHTALPAVLELIQLLSGLDKPLHFHLHDGHPLSTVSAYGLPDHLHFLSEIPIPFEYRGRKWLNPMFGPFGLSEIVEKTVQSLSTELVSYTLEIHPVDKKTPLGNASHLFHHWKDKTNAERMNSWLTIIQRNQTLLSDVWKKHIENLLVT
ncbi:MAG: hypothetical protein D8M57_07055 [Candidatus Scalindua sp. AMX11]|nr:MAG: hypothetical protein DWQ00_14625 [Candidatus Scalindua sp.]RZV82434.1 MAG: hypothetical protein EX341_09695 [Candidatus Scalindua sp. SCAELEC01]TDE65644.1 MAG: hypothetical protein D8M57_07055 [Candidatus Scalindua sp. AMX11]